MWVSCFHLFDLLSAAPIRTSITQSVYPSQVQNTTLVYWSIQHLSLSHYGEASNPNEFFFFFSFLLCFSPSRSTDGQQTNQPINIPGCFEMIESGRFSLLRVFTLLRPVVTAWRRLKRQTSKEQFKFVALAVGMKGHANSMPRWENPEKSTPTHPRHPPKPNQLNRADSAGKFQRCL